MELQKIKQAVVRFIKDEEGLTVVEYAVAGGLIALTVVAAFTVLGEGVGTTINNLAACLGAGDGTCPGGGTE